MNQLSDARLIDLPRHARADGEVIVAEAAAQVPFRIERMFALARPPRASSVLAIHGLRQRRRGCRLRRRKQEKHLCAEPPQSGLLVPPGLWNTVEFRQNESVLIVLCDRVYEADDYIRDYAEFLSFRESVRV
jgi:hypothetical protein